MDQHTQHRTMTEDHISYLTEDRKCPVQSQICLWMIGLILTAPVVAQVRAEEKEYAPQWERSVPFGENCSITEVPSVTCGINFDFFTDTKELDCNNVHIPVSVKCVFASGHIQPDPCYGLTFYKGIIWKPHITTSFSFCATKRCYQSPTVIESGIIFLYFSTPSGSVTTATTTFSTIRQPDQSTVREPTTDIGSTRIPILAESSIWKYVLIVISVVLLLLLLLTLVYYRGRDMKFCKRCKRHRPERLSSGASDGQPDVIESMLRDSMETRHQMQALKCYHSQRKKLSTLSPTEVKRIGKKLKQIYTNRYNVIKTCSPLDPNEWMELDRIYTNIALLLDNKQTRKQPLEFSELLCILTSRKQTERLILIGEAGVGKTSLLSKIAHDWAKGRCLKGICLLFLLPLREVEESKYFGDYLPDDLEIEGWRMDEYIKSNPKKVMLLFDGLDEHKGELRNGNLQDAIIRILTVNKFVETPLVITTRPWGAEQITSSIKLNRLYTLVEVEGFHKKDVAQYIRKFFEKDKYSAETLIHLIENDSIVSNNMAPFPIFCNMLCYIWREESKRQTIQRLKTFSQLLYEMVYFLQEHSCARRGEGKSFHDYRRRCNDSFKMIGEVAFYGLMERKLVFDGEAFESSQDAVKIACEVGVLTREKRFAPKVMRQKQDVTHIEDIRFPHKLLQEYLAGVFLASVNQTDPDEFKKLLNVLLEHYKEFRYLFYFTAAQDNKVGTALMDLLCKNVKDINFIIEIAFECHDKKAITPVVKLLRRQTSLTIDGYYSTSHTESGYLFAMDACNQYMAHESNQIWSSHQDTSSQTSGAGLFSLPNLRLLTLVNLRLDDDWFVGMASVAGGSKIKELHHRSGHLGPTASREYAGGIFSMTSLQSVKLIEMKLADEFFCTMAQLSSQSMIKELIHVNAHLGPAASSDYAKGVLTIQSLQSLKLDYVELADEFFSTMAELSSQSKIRELHHWSARLGPTASREYARGILSMPSLQSLQLSRMKLADEFFSTVAQLSSQSQIQDLRIDNYVITQRILRSILSLPRLKSLTFCLIKCEPISEIESEMSAIVTKSVISLGVDATSIRPLCECDLHTLCPSITTITLIVDEIDGSVPDIPAELENFPHLIELNIRKDHICHSRLNLPTTFCQSVISSCPGINKLSIADITMGNETATGTIRSMMAHDHMTSIQLIRCATNSELDEIISDINGRGRLTVIAEHGVPRS